MITDVDALDVNWKKQTTTKYMDENQMNFITLITQTKRKLPNERENELC